MIFAELRCTERNALYSSPKLLDFWGGLKSRAYDGGWEAKSEQALKQRICLKLQEFTTEDCQRLMRSVKKNLQKAADAGVQSVI